MATCLVMELCDNLFDDNTIRENKLTDLIICKPDLGIVIWNRLTYKEVGVQKLSKNVINKTGFWQLGVDPRYP